jgi:hypothetical protein
VVYDLAGHNRKLVGHAWPNEFESISTSVKLVVSDDSVETARKQLIDLILKELEVLLGPVDLGPRSVKWMCHQLSRCANRKMQRIADDVK